MGVKSSGNTGNQQENQKDHAYGFNVEFGSKVSMLKRTIGGGSLKNGAAIGEDKYVSRK